MNYMYIKLKCWNKAHSHTQNLWQNILKHVFKDWALSQVQSSVMNIEKLKFHIKKTTTKNHTVFLLHICVSKSSGVCVCVCVCPCVCPCVWILDILKPNYRKEKEQKKRRKTFQAHLCSSEPMEEKNPTTEVSSSSLLSDSGWLIQASRSNLRPHRQHCTGLYAPASHRQHCTGL